MKALVVFYSSSGNTRMIAHTIAETLNADEEELKPVKALNANGIGYVFWGIRQLVTQSKPSLLSLTHNPDDYDLIVIGTPVWSYTITPPIRSFLENYHISGKKIAIFCCHGGGKGKTLENMKSYLQDNEIIGETDFCEPLKNSPEENKKNAAEWIKNITEK